MHTLKRDTMINMNYTEHGLILTQETLVSYSNCHSVLNDISDRGGGGGGAQKGNVNEKFV